MLNLLKLNLKQLLNDIDSGNSNISESDQQKIIDLFQEINKEELTKTEACDYIGVCKSTFNNYIKKGLIPEGKERQGTSNKFWNKSDLNKYLNKK